MCRITKILLWSMVGFFVLQMLLAREKNGIMTALLGNEGFYHLLLCDLWGFVVIGVIIWAIEARKLQRMRDEFEYVKTLKGPDLVNYLVEKRGWGNNQGDNDTRR